MSSVLCVGSRPPRQTRCGAGDQVRIPYFIVSASRFPDFERSPADAALPEDTRRGRRGRRGCYPSNTVTRARTGKDTIVDTTPVSRARVRLMRNRNA